MSLPCNGFTFQYLKCDLAQCCAFRFSLAFHCPPGGASPFTVANAKQEIGLLTATFLLGLGFLEMLLHLIGV